MMELPVWLLIIIGLALMPFAAVGLYFLFIGALILMGGVLAIMGGVIALIVLGFSGVWKSAKWKVERRRRLKDRPDAE